MDPKDRNLLLLGLLRVEEMHGYQLNQFLEEHLAFLPSLKPSTAYYALEKLAEKGWVTVRTEQVGNRPSRQIYEISEQGEAEYRALLRRNLARYAPGESADDIGIAFIQDLAAADGHALLDEKREAMRDRLDRLRAVADRLAPDDAMHLSLSRAIRRVELDLTWLEEIEAWLQHRSSGTKQ